MRLLIFSSILAYLTLSALAQNPSTTNPNENYGIAQIDSIINVIEQKEINIESVKKNQLPDSLSSLIEDYAQLASFWEIEYENIYKQALDLQKIQVLLSESDSVFISDLPDVGIVPLSLKNHYDLISQISNIQTEINDIEKTIDEKTDICKQINVDPMTIVPNFISSDLESLYSKIVQIKETGLTTFSNQQKKYFENNIIGKYNNFEKYFTNE